MGSLPPPTSQPTTPRADSLRHKPQRPPHRPRRPAAHTASARTALPSAASSAGPRSPVNGPTPSSAPAHPARGAPLRGICPWHTRPWHTRRSERSSRHPVVARPVHGTPPQARLTTRTPMRPLAPRDQRERPQRHCVHPVNRSLAPTAGPRSPPGQPDARAAPTHTDTFRKPTRPPHTGHVPTQDPNAPAPETAEPIPPAPPQAAQPRIPLPSQELLDRAPEQPRIIHPRIVRGSSLHNDTRSRKQPSHPTNRISGRQRIHPTRHQQHRHVQPTQFRGRGNRRPSRVISLRRIRQPHRVTQPSVLLRRSIPTPVIERSQSRPIRGSHAPAEHRLQSGSDVAIPRLPAPPQSRGTQSRRIRRHPECPQTRRHQHQPPHHCRIPQRIPDRHSRSRRVRQHVHRTQPGVSPEGLHVVHVQVEPQRRRISRTGPSGTSQVQQEQPTGQPTEITEVRRREQWTTGHDEQRRAGAEFIVCETHGEDHRKQRSQQVANSSSRAEATSTSGLSWRSDMSGLSFDSAIS